jgi:phosphoacetylglucosamine mutase
MTDLLYRLSTEKLDALVKKYPPPPEQGDNRTFFQYGTAGIRTKGVYLPSVSLRIGMLCALRSFLAKGQAVGAMITASHNSHPDNGIKIVDTNGGMLVRSWEIYAAQIANCVEGQEIVEVLRRVVAEESTSDATNNATAGGVVVHVGRDTRPSGVVLNDALFAGVALITDALVSTPSVSPFCVEHGVITTPILHAMVYFHNNEAAAQSTFAYHVTPPKESAYYQLVAESFEKLHRLLKTDATPSRKRLVVDCSNGVGSVAIKTLFEKSVYLQEVFELELVNDNITDPVLLNFDCGADHCQRTQRPPLAFSAVPLSDLQTSFYCLDGDSDRLVSFAYPRAASSEGVLLDGDRIAILCATLLRKLISEEDLARLDVGVVQTAYANGASTAYAAQLGLKTYCAATGVKNCHAIAEHCDIGMYFEANGHGTVLFKEQLQKEIPILATLAGLLSQVCGDAIGDLLACEVALVALGWSDTTSWLQMYNDLPSNQSKITVPNPSRIKNTKDDRKATAPAGLQESIDAIVSSSEDPSARAFVRPSGTEPIVRLYVEASTKEMVDQLKDLITAVVLEMLP